MAWITPAFFELGGIGQVDLPAFFNRLRLSARGNLAEAVPRLARVVDYYLYPA